MLNKKLTPILFVFCLYLGGQIFLPSGVAFAGPYDCCGCGSQSWCASDNSCHCPGAVQWCIYCAAPESDIETVKSTPPTQDPSGAINMRGISAPVLSFAAADMIIDIRRSNGRTGLMLKLAEIDKIMYDLKFSCPQPEGDYLQGNRLGLHVKADIKK